MSMGIRETFCGDGGTWGGVLTEFLGYALMPLMCGPEWTHLFLRSLWRRARYGEAVPCPAPLAGLLYPTG